MIPMSCPSCGRRGNVPLDRLNTRMHCKKCDAVFHLDATGKPVLGEPKAAKGGKSASKSRSKDEPLDPIGMLASKLAQVPKGVYFSLLGIGAIYVLYTLLYAGLSSGPMDRESTLRAKASDLAEAFLKKDSETIKGMATDDSKDEAGKLVEQFRGSLNDSGATAESPVFVTVGPASPDPQPIITIDFNPPTPEGSTSAPPAAHLDTPWFEAKGKWYLNGKDTLQMNKDRAERETPKAAKKK